MVDIGILEPKSCPTQNSDNISHNQRREKIPPVSLGNMPSRELINLTRARSYRKSKKVCQ